MNEVYGVQESSRVGQQASRHSLLRPPLEDRAPPSRTLEHDAVTDRRGQRVVAGREGLLAVAEQNQGVSSVDGEVG